MRASLPRATFQLHSAFRTPHSALASCSCPSKPSPGRRAVPCASWTSARSPRPTSSGTWRVRSEEHTSELQSRLHLVCRLLLEKKKIHLVYRTYGSCTGNSLVRIIRKISITFYHN